jgi:hypothetical protein
VRQHARRRRQRATRGAAQRSSCARVFSERAIAGTVGDAQRRPSEPEQSGGVRGGEPSGAERAQRVARSGARSAGGSSPRSRGASPRFRRSEGPCGPSEATQEPSRGRRALARSARADPPRSFWLRLRHPREPTGAAEGRGTPRRAPDVSDSERGRWRARGPPPSCAILRAQAVRPARPLPYRTQRFAAQRLPRSRCEELGDEHRGGGQQSKCRSAATARAVPLGCVAR